MEMTQLPEQSSTCLGDAYILSEIADGDLSHFGVFMKRYKERLMSYIVHRIPDRHHAEDLVQETFLRFFRASQAGSYRGQSTVATWLFTIATNCVTDFVRVSVRRPLTLESDIVAKDDASSSDLFGRCYSAGPGPADVAAYHESQESVNALLRRLPDEQRQVVALKVFGELTFQEIADVVGCPLGTAKSRLIHGLRKIEAMFSRSEDLKHGQ